MNLAAPPILAPVTGRLAPSPTGYLHLGNAWAFLLAWLAARAAQGRIILRIEDIDPDRSRSHFADALIHDLHWLGLDWDEGPDKPSPHTSPAFYVQSQRLPLYSAALETLSRAGYIYPCYCTRKELRSLASAPHVDDAGAPYPNICRNLPPAQRAAKEQAARKAGRGSTLRLRCPEGADFTFNDAVQGPQHISLKDCGGDFALRRSDGIIAYQLAVVVDDALMNVTQVVRGDDIRISTPRQMLLCHMLGYTPPRYAHLPLLCDHNGERLAKRHASLSLGALRECGIAPQAIVGYLAHKAGLIPRPVPCQPQALSAHFSFAALPRHPQRTEEPILQHLLAISTEPEA